jgi:hypothetical protein
MPRITQRKRTAVTGHKHFPRINLRLLSSAMGEMGGICPTGARSSYGATIAETNVTSLEHLVYETEEAITRRLQELVRTSSDPAELTELRAAADQLLLLKVQRLGWPDPLKSKTAH